MVSLSMPLSDPWPGFQVSRGFVSDSWAFLFLCVIVFGVIVCMLQSTRKLKQVLVVVGRL